MFAAMNDEDGFLFNLIEGENINYQIHSILVSQESKEEVDRIHQILKMTGMKYGNLKWRMQHILLL